MPKFKKYEITHQFNHFTLWETLAYLVPKQDAELRERVYKMSRDNYDASAYGSCFTESSVDEQGEELSNAELWSDEDVLDTDDPGFQKYCQSELDLLNEVHEKYKDQSGHGLMMTYINALRHDTEHLKNGLPLETSVCASIFGGVTGLTKMKDVVISLEGKDINNKDMLKSNFKDTTVYEQAAEEFGITSMYEEYNATMENGAEWQKQWQNGEPDPAKLEELGEKLRGNIRRLDTKIKHFEQQYLADAKLPDEQRKIYNIANHSDVSKCDLIATEEEFATQSGLRAVNGVNWENKKTGFEKSFEKQLLAAKLMKLQKSFDGSESRALRENTQRLIDDCTVSQKNPRGNEKPLPAQAHYALLDTVRQEAARLAEKAPAAKGIIEAADFYMSNPAVKQAETRKADKWIERYQKSGLLKPGANGKSVVDTDGFADIMAARMLADSVRGDNSSLAKPISAKEIADKANELRNDPTFQGFLDRLKSDPKAMKSAYSAAKSGHGGALDDLFRDHVKKLPAGQLSNTPLMARYLPTAKERIEILQARAAKEQPQELENTVAEIMVLRNLAHAERGKKSSINKPIPTDPDNSLKTQTNTLRRDAVFAKRVREHRAVTLNLIAGGHGGEMAEHFRDPDGKTPAFSREAKKILNANTIGGRLDELRQKAAELRDNSTLGPMGKRDRAGKLLSEYLVLDGLSRDPVTKKVDPARLQADVPYARMEKSVELGYAKEPQFNAYMKSIDDQTLETTFLDDLANKHQDSLIEDIGKSMTAFQQKTQRRTQSEPSKQLETPQKKTELEA